MAMKSLSTQPCAFLFDSLGPDEDRGETLDDAFLNALKAVDPNGITTTRIYRGGLLLARLSYKPMVIKAAPRRQRKPGGPVTSESSTREHADMGLYATLVGDFVESCLERWNTFDATRLAAYVGNHALDATFVSSLPTKFAMPMDKRLRAHPRYIGAVAPDLGNPLHTNLFIEVMFKDAFIESGNVVVRADFDGDCPGSFFGAEAFSRSGMVVLPYEEFEETAPPGNLPSSLSARGLITEMRMHRRMALDVHQKIANALSHSRVLSDVSQPFEWDLSQLPDAPEEVAVQARKLADYLLDPKHQDGKSKAKFFKQQLDITRSDWSFLQPQLVDGLSNVTYKDVRLDEHGIRFTAFLPVTGRNGATATIETGWIVRPGERASFVTAIPGRKDEALEKQATPPAVIPAGLTGEARWQAIYDLADQAGIDAIEACVPKPLVVQGNVYMDGDCGGAYVVVHDARKEFARWLKTSGKGSRNYPTGYSVTARQSSQSAETARAYGNAFAKVLLRNGVSCRVETYLT